MRGQKIEIKTAIIDHQTYELRIVNEGKSIKHQTSNMKH